jgi:Immunoglobulin domain
MSVNEVKAFGWVMAACVLAASSTARAQTGYSITGGLSNFDCTNHCDDPCDEFEIEIEGIRPEDVMGTYHNGNYGSPAVVLSSDGTFTIIDYHNPSHLTSVGTIEHFGVHLRQLSASTPIRVRWMRGGAPARVNGQIPIPGGGSAPSTQPMMPQITADMGLGSTGGDGVVLSVTNTDPTQSIWIKRRAQVMVGASVRLDALMPNDPTVTSTLQIDPSPVRIGPGQTMTYTSDLVEVEDHQSVVFAAEYYQNLHVGGPFNSSDILGPELGNVMTAALTNPGTGCEESQPVIQAQPQNASGALGSTVNLRVRADGNDVTLSYQWLKDGQPIVDGRMYHGATTDELSIEELTNASEGFYCVQVSNACGTAQSVSALVFVTGHNTVLKPLAATIDASSISAASGDAVVMNGSIAFAPPGTTYVWKRNGVAIVNGSHGASAAGGVVSGAAGIADGTPATLTIDGIQASDAGSYSIVYVNSAGFAASAPTEVVIDAPCSLAVDSNPQPGSSCFMGAGFFSVAAHGADPIAYQWQLDTGSGTWFDLSSNPVVLDCGGGTGEAVAVPDNSPDVIVAVAGCEGPFNVRCVLTDSCGTVATDPVSFTMCVADFNCDGGVDGADVESFITTWETGDSLADVNADGGVDGGDVEYFFSRWQGGC